MNPTVIDPANITPLHDRIIVRHLEEKPGLIMVVRENPELIDFVGDGNNGENNDNRRVGLKSVVISVGSSVHSVKKGDLIMHSAWNDFPDWFRTAIPKGYALIRENDIFGTFDTASA